MLKRDPLRWIPGRVETIWLGWRKEVRFIIADVRRWLAHHFKRIAEVIYEWIYP